MHRKISQVCLYIGILMGLIALDWTWYAQKYPGSSFILQLSWVSVVYGVFLAVMAACFVAAAVFAWKARVGQAVHHRGTGRRKG